jgi:hypothetical protein
MKYRAGNWRICCAILLITSHTSFYDIQAETFITEIMNGHTPQRIQGYQQNETSNFVSGIDFICICHNSKYVKSYFSEFVTGCSISPYIKL